MVSLSFGHGLVLRSNLRFDLEGSDRYLECTFQGYYAYAEEPANEGEDAAVRPWGPEFELLDARPDAPK